jgi:hypothetical protein
MKSKPFEPSEPGGGTPSAIVVAAFWVPWANDSTARFAFGPSFGTGLAFGFDVATRG